MASLVPIVGKLQLAPEGRTAGLKACTIWGFWLREKNRQLKNKITDTKLGTAGDAYAYLE